MPYKDTTPNPTPRMHHPLADQQDWWSDDESIKLTETSINSGVDIDPTLIQEGGWYINPTGEGLTVASDRE